jgi:hypothetical protein
MVGLIDAALMESARPGKPDQRNLVFPSRLDTKVMDISQKGIAKSG